MRYKNRYVYALTPDIAYTVGLMASDGCLQKDGRHLDLTSVDVEQLDNFSKALGRKLKIGSKYNKLQQVSYRVQFSDVVYYDLLLQIGLSPAKSKTIGALNIPDELYADFLRGLFDGDGTSYGYMDRRWKSSFMFYTSFTSASLNFIYYLQATNSRLIGVTPASIRNGKRAYSLVYAKADSQKLARFIYYSDEVICLSRKKVKLAAFIAKEQADIISRQ